MATLRSRSKTSSSVWAWECKSPAQIAPNRGFIQVSHPEGEMNWLRSTRYHPRLDPLEVGIHDADDCNAEKASTAATAGCVSLLGAWYPARTCPACRSRKWSPDLLQRLPAKPDRQGIRWLDEKRTKRHGTAHLNIEDLREEYELLGWRVILLEATTRTCR